MNLRICICTTGAGEKPVLASDTRLNMERPGFVFNDSLFIFIKAHIYNFTSQFDCIEIICVARKITIKSAFCSHTFGKFERRAHVPIIYWTICSGLQT